MIGQPTPNPINSEYPTGDLDAFQQSMLQPKQQYAAPEYNEPEIDDTIEDDGSDGEPIDVEMTATAARATGKLIATVIDGTIPISLAYIAKEPENVDNYKATADEKDELTDALTEYVRLKGGDIPPGVMVLILVLTIYGGKVPMALEARKLNIKNEELEKREKALAEKEQALNLRIEAVEKKLMENNDDKKST